MKSIKERFVLLLVGILIIGGSSWHVWHRLSFRQAFLPAEGKAHVDSSVIEHGGADTYNYSIQFADQNGHEHTVRFFTVNSTLGDVDTTTVTIYYNPKNPRQFFLPGYLFSTARIVVLSLLVSAGIGAVAVGLTGKDSWR